MSKVSREKREKRAARRAKNPENKRKFYDGLDNDLIKIGYWLTKNDSETHNLPNPANQIDSQWSLEEKNKVIYHLKCAKVLLDFSCSCSSSCRICNKSNGNSVLSDGTFQFPSGFLHYVEDHGVKPSADFIRHVLGETR